LVHEQWPRGSSVFTALLSQKTTQAKSLRGPWFIIYLVDILFIKRTNT
jgi:hypothetical protein